MQAGGKIWCPGIWNLLQSQAVSPEECRYLPSGAWPWLCVKCGLASLNPPEKKETDDLPRKVSAWTTSSLWLSWQMVLIGKGMWASFETGLLLFRQLAGCLYRLLTVSWPNIISFPWNPVSFLNFLFFQNHQPLSSESTCFPLTSKYNSLPNPKSFSPHSYWHHAMPDPYYPRPNILHYNLSVVGFPNHPCIWFPKCYQVTHFPLVLVYTDAFNGSPLSTYMQRIRLRITNLINVLSPSNRYLLGTCSVSYSILSFRETSMSKPDPIPVRLPKKGLIWKINAQK